MTPANVKMRTGGTNPWIVAAALLVVLFARWILVTGYGDFGTDYDLTSRLMQGQWQGRDFLAVFPFGSGYSLMLFEKLLGDSYWVVGLHVWFWWLLNVVVAAALASATGATKPTSALAACAVALLMAPPNTHGVSFAFIASALSGLSVVLFLNSLKARAGYYAGAAGFVAGLAVFAKPNVGVAAAGAMVSVCLAMALFDAARRKQAVYAAILVVVGAAAGAGSALAVPGYFGGYREVLKEIFEGGSSIKGGPAMLLSRAFPRISTSIDSPHRFLIELGIAVPLLGFSLLAFARMFRKDANRSAPSSEIALLRILLAAVTLLSVWSLFPWDVPMRLTAWSFRSGILSVPFFSWQVLYLLELAFLFVSIAVGVRRGELREGITAPVWIALLTFVWTVGLAASARHNSVFAVTLAIPALTARMNNLPAQRLFCRLLTAFLIIWTASWHLAPNWRTTFARLTPLPADSKFAGLYWPEGGASVPGSYSLWSSASMIEQCQKNIAPRVARHSVLWLVPAAGAVFGGEIYTFGINELVADSFPAWGESRLAASLSSRLPDYIVSDDLRGWKDPRWVFLNPAHLEPWLAERYTKVWSLTDNPAPLYLWKKKD